MKFRSWGHHVVTALLGIAAMALLAGALLVQFDHLRFEPVLSGSMRPGIQPGDLAILRPVPVHELRVGNVIAYLPPGQSTPVMHRIISRTATGILTKGDDNTSPDPWGRVALQGSQAQRLVVVVPKLGWLAAAKRQLLIGMSSFVLVLLGASLWDEKRKARKVPAHLAPTRKRQPKEVHRETA